MTVTAVKTIKFEDLMKVMKKYVATSQTRPILTTVKYDGEYFIATDSHVLLRVKADCVTDIPQYTEGEFLFNPVKMEKVSDMKVSSYPDVSRIIPQYSDSTVLINNKNIKEFHDNIKAIRKLSKKTKVVKLEFGQLGTIISGKMFKEGNSDLTHKAVMENVFVEGKELTICASDMYLNNALDSVKRLSKLSKDQVEIRMQGHMRPIHFTQYNVFELLVLPIRVW